MHGRKGKALARDVRRRSSVCDVCRIYHARRGDIRYTFIPKLPYYSKAAVFTKVAQHSAPIVTRLETEAEYIKPFQVGLSYGPVRSC